jgi:hypothetical protein
MVDERRNFIGSRATPKRLCLGRVGRRRRCSPICRSQRAAEQDSVRVFASFPHSVLDSEAPSMKSFPGAWYEQGRSFLNTGDCHECFVNAAVKGRAHSAENLYSEMQKTFATGPSADVLSALRRKAAEYLRRVAGSRGCCFRPVKLRRIWIGLLGAGVVLEQRHEVIKRHVAGGDELTCAPGGEGYRSILLSSRIYSSVLLRPRSSGRTRSLKGFHTAITAEC